MLRWLLRAVFVRFLPRRLLPILTAIELVNLIRSRRRRKYAINEPTRSRTSLPPTQPPEVAGRGRATPPRQPGR
jgi:hypothetical protein